MWRDIDHFDSFSRATGEIALNDKTHLMHHLANIDTVCKVVKLDK